MSFLALTIFTDMKVGRSTELAEKPKIMLRISCMKFKGGFTF